MVERLNGATSDEDEEDEVSETENDDRDNCSVHSTTAGRSRQLRM